jgi:hypothetical protein
VVNHMLAELATVLLAEKEDHPVEHILDWEAKEVVAHLPSWEPAQRISRYH